jgi:transcriptional repressor NrdR
MAESAPWAVGELVREALSTVDPVAYIRIALVYRNFREAKGFWRVPRADRGG